MTRQQQYAEHANANGLLIAVHDGVDMGIGTRDELNGLIAEGVLPKETVLRDARSEDF